MENTIASIDNFILRFLTDNGPKSYIQILSKAMDRGLIQNDLQDIQKRVNSSLGRLVMTGLIRLEKTETATIYSIIDSLQD